MPEIPEPFLSIWPFIKQKREPYHTILVHVYSDLVRSNVYYVNPHEIFEILRKQGKLKIEGKNKNIKIGTVRRTLYAVIHGKKLVRDIDYRVTSSRNRKNLKFINTPSTLSAFRSLV